MDLADPDDRANDVTVLAIAPDGTWGAATEPFASRAIPVAIANCKRRYGAEIGCGYKLTTIRAGWSLGFRCGDRNIIVADKELAAAKRMALQEERELRARYVPDLPACEPVVVVDPDGVALVPALAFASPAPPHLALRPDR